MWALCMYKHIFHYVMISKKEIGWFLHKMKEVQIIGGLCEVVNVNSTINWTEIRLTFDGFKKAKPFFKINLQNVLLNKLSNLLERDFWSNAKWLKIRSKPKEIFRSQLESLCQIRFPENVRISLINSLCNNSVCFTYKTV